MKYLLNFKKYNLFESSTYDIYDLEVDENEVEEYFMNNYNVDEEEYEYMGSNIFNYMSSESETEFMNNVIYDEKQQSIDEWDNDDLFKRYIIKYSKKFDKLLDEFFEDKTLKGLIKRYKKYQKSITYYDVPDLSLYILNAESLDDLDLEEHLELMTQEELKEMIIDEDESDYVDWAVDERYKDMTVEDYLTEMGYENFYEQVQYYLDFKKLDYDIKNDKDYNFKLEYYLGEICCDENAQNKVLEYDSKNAIYLFDIMNDNYYNGGTYYFQQMYIDEMKKENVEDYENEEEWKNEELPDILNDLDKKFSLNSKIKKKYFKYTKKIASRDFNL